MGSGSRMLVSDELERYAGEPVGPQVGIVTMRGSEMFSNNDSTAFAKLMQVVHELRDNRQTYIDELFALHKRALGWERRHACMGDIVAHVDEYMELCGECYDECCRLLNELPGGVRGRHIETVRQLMVALRQERTATLARRDRWYQVEASHPDARNMIEDLDMTVEDVLTYERDLEEICRRMKTLVLDPGEAAA